MTLEKSEKNWTDSDPAANVTQKADSDPALIVVDDVPSSLVRLQRVAEKIKLGTKQLTDAQKELEALREEIEDELGASFGVE